MVIDELLAYFGVDTDRQSFREAQRHMDALEESAHDMISTLGAMGAAAFGAGMLLNNNTWEIKQLSDALGVGVETTEAFGLAMAGTKHGVEDVMDLYEELSNKMGESKGLEETTPVLESLAMLKLSFADLKKMNPEKQMESILNAAVLHSDKQIGQSAADILLGGQANRIVGHLQELGGSFTDIIEKRKQYNFLSERGRNGAVESAKVTGDLLAIFKSLSRELSGLVGEALNPMLKGWRDFIAENKVLIQTQLPNLISMLGTTAKVLATLFAVSKVMMFGRAIMGLITTLRALTVAGLIANAAAMAVPLLIGAAVAAVGAGIALVIEDIYTFFQGGKSVTGFIVNAFISTWDRVVNYAYEKFGELKAWFSDLIPDWMRDGLSDVSMNQSLSANASPSVAANAYSAMYNTNAANSRVINFYGVTPPEMLDAFKKETRKDNAVTAKAGTTGVEY